MSQHAEKCRNKMSKKSATIICLLRNENKRYQHRTKNKLTREAVAKNKRKKNHKQTAKKHTTCAFNPELNLVSGVHGEKVSNNNFF